MGSKRRSRHPGLVQSHTTLLRDAVADRLLKFSVQGQHGTKHFAYGRQVIAGDPLAQSNQLLIEYGRAIEHADEILGRNFLAVNSGLAAMQVRDNPRHAPLAEGHEHASADYRQHPIGNAVGEDGVQRDWKSYIAELRHEGCACVCEGAMAS